MPGGTAYIGATGMLAMQKHLDVRAHNIANARTASYNAQSVITVDNPYVTMVAPGATSSSSGNAYPTGLQLGLGSRVVGTSRILTQGGPEDTGNQYDMMIDGNGYFQVEMPDGSTAYTRDGHFNLDNTRQIVDHSGRVLKPGLTVPENTLKIEVSRDGVVSALIDGQPDPVEVGTLSLASFANPQGLMAIGDNLFVETSASSAPTEGAPGSIGYGVVYQNAVEGSNVEMVIEMTEMLKAQNLYNACASVVKIGGETARIDADLARG